VARLEAGEQDIEPVMSHAAADVIFRTLFSIPIEDEIAAEVYREFRAYQRSQPILNLRAFLPLPRWMPRGHRRETLRAARRIRALITDLTRRRVAEIAAGTAPDDLATKILTARDPETGERLSAEEMVDQVAIFFLAGHETSASALSWTLYLLARYPEWQERVAAEVAGCRRRQGRGHRAAFGDAGRVPRGAAALSPGSDDGAGGGAGGDVSQPAVPRGRAGGPLALASAPAHAALGRTRRVRSGALGDGEWQGLSAAGLHPVLRRGAGLSRGGVRDDGGAASARAAAAAVPVRHGGGAEPVPVAFLTVRARDGIRLRVSER
jgi:hypothetical protein